MPNKGAMATYKGTNGSDVLTLHCLPLREPRANENRVVGYFMRDFVREASKRCGCPDER